MFKEHKFKIIISSIITILPIFFGLAMWDRLPEKIATHWGPDGNPDGYSGKLTAVVLLPLLVLAIHLLCIFFTSLDKKNSGQNKKVFGFIFWICPAVSLVTSSFTYMQAFNVKFSVGSICIALMAVLFIIIGNYMPKCKQNYTIGIKIPTTLNSEENWNATHRLAGIVWVICGVLLLPGIFLPKNFLPWMLIATLPAVLIPVIYSIIYDKKHK
ncbi:MAG: SdpI family protein [Clostridia bacterium]|nr:SdpI family protein [Clostridia bacterium]